MNPEPNTQSTLKASYTSPTTSQTFTHTLPSASASTSSTKEKTQYLSNLRKAVVQLQDEVNDFLTVKMEDDKALARGNAAGKVDEKKEEDYYGEEGGGEEDG